MIDSANPTLHKAPEAFDAICVNFPANIYATLVSDSIVPETCWAPVLVTQFRDSEIGWVLVGVDHAARSNVIPDKSKQFLFPSSLDGSRNNFPASLDDGDNWSLFFVSATRTANAPFAHATIVSFVHFNRRPLQLQITVRHKGADLLEYAPSSFVGDPSLALNLLCRDAATSGTHQVRSVEPQPKRSGGLLKNSAGKRIDVIPAVIARIGSAASHAMVLPFLFALLAVSHAARIALLFDVFKARRIIRKLSVEVPNAVAKCFWDLLFDSHNGLILPNRRTCCQGILTNGIIGIWKAAPSVPGSHSGKTTLRVEMNRPPNQPVTIHRRRSGTTSFLPVVERLQMLCIATGRR